MNRFILIQFLLIILIACSASKKSVSNVPATVTLQIKEVAIEAPVAIQVQKDTIPVVFKIDTIFKMARGSCFGNCPVYDFSILNDGTVIWKGFRNTTKLGMHISKLDQKKIIEIQQNTKQILNLGLSSFYPEKKHEVIPDFPTVSFNFFDKTQSKKIVVNHSAPKILFDLSDKLEGWLDNTEWIKIEP